MASRREESAEPLHLFPAWLVVGRRRGQPTEAAPAMAHGGLGRSVSTSPLAIRLIQRPYLKERATDAALALSSPPLALLPTS
jgi:hypothetical protein